ncbi:MAG: AMP-binding protein [Alphaproteobacteria bacterium]|nr:AMP-binding protein [Alphaproteobacteria bacterium]MCB9794671.1 AMP-binding protein [Alphaproteobacteria bacterium]
MILQRLLKHPDGALALIDRGRPLSYGALRDRAARLAAALPEAGVVLVDLEKSADWVVAVLACAWRGLPFCPLSPASPPERRRQMAQDAQAVAVIAQEDPGLGLPWTGPAAGGAPRPPAAFDPERLAWLIFTSGSSGAPKAVEVPWRFVPTLVRAQVEAIGLEAGERCLMALDVGFDATQSDLWCALYAGATLVIEEGLEQPERLLACLREREVAYADLPPALLRRLSVSDRPPSLRCVLIGGEVCPAETVRAWAQALRLLVVYGPTECCVCTSLQRADATWDRPWIGQPLPGVRYRVVDEALEPVPEGQPGELLIGGPCVARGYRGAPALSARRFPVLEGERWHRSGDLVVREADGWRFIGRVDRQVKLAGRRVGLAEIEAVLTEHPEVQRAHVRLVEGRLQAFVEGGSPEVLRAWAAARLPPWMRPQLHLVSRLPTTPSGKVDAAALAAPEAEALEGLICALWSEALGRPVGPRDSLSAAGADSVAVLEVAAQAEARGLAAPPALWLGVDSVAEVLARRGADPGRSAASLRAPAPALSARPLPVGPPRRLLVTGATGGLGRALLPRLLARCEAELLCLVRAPDPAAAQARLPLQHPRLTAIPGDLGAPRLGLSPARWAELAEQVDGVVHGGARVHLLAEAEALWPVNVEGSLRALALCAEGAPKRLHLISTLSVFVATDRHTGLALEEDRLSQTRRVWGGYAQSKFAAERACWDSGLAALAVYRPGLLVGGEAQGELLPRLLRGLALLGVAPEGALALELDITPLQEAADALARLIAQDARGGFHLAAPRPATLGDLVEALRAEGVAIELTEDAAFTGRLRAARHPDAAAAALALCRRLDPEAFASLRSLDLFQATGVRFDARRCAEALGGPAIPAPTPERLRALVRAALSA